MPRIPSWTRLAMFTGTVLLASACGTLPTASDVPDASDTLTPAETVDPMIGTGGHGHTFPGASAPFGMVQLSPDTRLTGWDGCSGYHADDELIYGFSHTHLSGTGVSDYGDILLMPTVSEAPLADASSEAFPFTDRFTHANEDAAAGRYNVTLDAGIEVELTASPRVGLHRYRFRDGSAAQRVFVDLEHRDEVLSSSFEQTGDNEVSGAVVMGKGFNVPLFQAQIFNNKVEDSTSEVAQETEDHERMELFDHIKPSFHNKSEDQEGGNPCKKYGSFDVFLLHKVSQAGKQPG